MCFSMFKPRFIKYLLSLPDVRNWRRDGRIRTLDVDVCRVQCVVIHYTIP